METSGSTKLRDDSVSKSDAGTSFSSRYKLIRPLKKGGTSQLYLVEDRLCSSSATVIKLIRNDISQAHSRQGLAVSEFSIARQLAHPNIINIYNVHQKNTDEYLVMEYLEGSSLNELLAREHLNYQQVIKLLTPVVSALTYLHENGIVHCDIKPSNIFVTRNHSTKLIDLANCRQDSNNFKPNFKIIKKPFFGFSERYSSLRIINDEPATICDDIYSLAVVIYEMLNGSLPTLKSKGGAFRLDLSHKPEGINYSQWKVLKKALLMKESDHFNSVKTFFEAFVNARTRLRLVLATVTSTVLSVFVCGFLLHQWSDHQARYTAYQAAKQQLDRITQTAYSIRELEPTKRYTQLAKLDELDEFSRRVVLSDVYEDVALPIVDQANSSIKSKSGTSEWSELIDRLHTLKFYYGRSQEIADSITALESERLFRQQSVSIALNELLESEQFDLSLASQINDLAELYREQWPDIIPSADISAYLSSVETALGSENWSVAIELFHFGELINPVLPQALQSWPKDTEINKHVKNFSGYLASDQVSKAYFPAESADFFFAERLDAVNQSLSNIWFNKDIKRYSSELLEIKSEYKIPENYERYQQTYNLLLNKIDVKIRHHQRSGQRQSMQDLIKLKNTLS